MVAGFGSSPEEQSCFLHVNHHYKYYIDLPRTNSTWPPSGPASATVNNPAGRPQLHATVGDLAAAINIGGTAHQLQPCAPDGLSTPSPRWRPAPRPAAQLLDALLVAARWFCFGPSRLPGRISAKTRGSTLLRGAGSRAGHSRTPATVLANANHWYYSSRVKQGSKQKAINDPSMHRSHAWIFRPACYLHA